MEKGKELEPVYFLSKLSKSLIGLVEKRKELEPVYFLSKLSKSLIGPVEKRKELEPVYFLSKLSKSLIGPVEKRRRQGLGYLNAPRRLYIRRPAKDFGKDFGPKF